MSESRTAYPDCSGAATCALMAPREVEHSPSCLSRYLTDAEQETWSIPTDDELRVRRDVLDAGDVPDWARPHPYLTPAERLLAAEQRAEVSS